MQQYDSTLWGYRYTLDTGNLIPVLNENQQIDLCDPYTNETVLTMPAPYMVDNNGEHSYDVEVTLTRNSGVYLLSYYLPREWLADEERAWPVILDPVVSADCNCKNIEDNTLAENYTESYKDSTIECGYYPSTGIRRCYLKYVNLPSLTSADVIVDIASAGVLLSRVLRFVLVASCADQLLIDDLQNPGADTVDLAKPLPLIHSFLRLGDAFLLLVLGNQLLKHCGCRLVHFLKMGIQGVSQQHGGVGGFVVLLQVLAAALTPNADLRTLRRFHIGQQIISHLRVGATHSFKVSLHILSSFICFLLLF